MVTETEPRQTAVYRSYLHLLSMADDRLHGSLAGKLLMCGSFDLAAAELALAATIAGGAFLGVEPNASTLKAAIRNGSCDFMVNTLDEALRVLKNELRQGKPLSVGLLGAASEIFPAMLERGVQPDLIAEAATAKATEQNRTLCQFIDRGAQSLYVREIGGAKVENASSLVGRNAPQMEIVWTTANLADMRSLDRTALAWLRDNDSVRRRWLEQAPGSFHRQVPLERVLGVRTEEIDSLVDALRTSAPLQAPVKVSWPGPGGEPQSTMI